MREYVQERSSKLDIDSKEKTIEKLVEDFLRILGEDLQREGLRETPRRVSRMWIEELAMGYFVDPLAYVKTFEVEEYEGREGLVAVTNIPTKSICEHHLLPFFGYTHIVYVPSGRVLGFSKFARVIKVLSSRLQIQERLTEQIADFLEEVLNPRGLLVLQEALHTCALIRGVEESMTMMTVALRGVFREQKEMVNLALQLVNASKLPLPKFEGF
ncbi:MAG: GTP cyclohydrolase I [Sulfolobales archaeon]|nr:GTP cyclohydrolase I [Sulfolobales archaeon]MDW8082186.1 GTP cyclohydrolase I [Sulfolobales archaeon]